MARPTSRAIFDTQVAGGFAGLRAQLGYEALLHEMLGVRLRKSASFTRWDTRPLSEEQVGYAREDVLHLLELADALQGACASAAAWTGRARSAAHSRRHPTNATRGDLQPSAAGQLARPVTPRGRPRARAVARGTAREADRPVPSVLADAALVEIAKRRPPRSSAWRQIRGLNEGTLRRRGRAILDVVERGREREPIPVDGAAPPPATPATRR